MSEETLHGAEKAPKQTSSLGLKLGIGLVVLLLLGAIYGFVGLYAWQTGQETAREENLETQTNLVIDQIRLAQDDVANQNYQLAIGRLDRVLELVPDNQVAQTLRIQAQEGLDAGIFRGGALVLATPTLIPTLTPFPTSEGAVDVELEDGAEEAYIVVRDQLNAADYETRISLLLTYKNKFPRHQSQQINQWLYETYATYGRQLLYSPQVELGITYIDLASELGPLTAELQNLRYYGQQYLNGKSYYGINWTVTIPYFRELCSVAPNYQNSCGVLVEALEAYGDQVVLAGDACLASSNYQEAVSYGAVGLDTKIWNANQACSSSAWTPQTPGPWPTVTPLSQ